MWFFRETRVRCVAQSLVWHLPGVSGVSGSDHNEDNCYCSLIPCWNCSLMPCWNISSLMSKKVNIMLYRLTLNNNIVWLRKHCDIYLKQTVVNFTDERISNDYQVTRKTNIFFFVTVSFWHLLRVKKKKSQRAIKLYGRQPTKKNKVCINIICSQQTPGCNEGFCFIWCSGNHQQMKTRPIRFNETIVLEYL